MTRPAIAALVLLILGLLLVSGLWQPYAPAEPERQPLLTQRPNPYMQANAHRGGGNAAPENTLAAIEAAIERGAAWVELDIRYTSDGEPVLLHDADVDRTTDATGSLANYSLAEVQNFDAGSWFGAEYAHTVVPTLEQALGVMQGRVCAYWDAKEAPTMRAVELFRSYGFEKGCLVIHIYDEWSNMLHLLWPDAPLIRMVKDPALLADMVSEYPWLAAVRVQPNRLDAVLVDRAHTLGLSVFVRATDPDEDATTLINHAAASGVDVITLDDLDAFKAWKLASRSSGSGPVDATPRPAGRAGL